MSSSPTPTVDKIRTAVGNSTLSRRLHQNRQACSEPYNLDTRSFHTLYIKCGVYGGVHGCSFAACTLTIRAALGDSHLPMRNICAMAVPVGLALGYAISSFYSCERKFMLRDRAREEWELQNFRQGELDEMRQIYRDQGFTADEAEDLVRIIARDDTILVDVMMVEELGYSRQPLPQSTEAAKAAAIAASSFICYAILPHLIPSPPGPRADALRILLLAGLGVVLSIAQSKLLFGAYAKPRDGVRLSLRNVIMFALVCLLSRIICSFKANARS